MALSHLTLSDLESMCVTSGSLVSDQVPCPNMTILKMGPSSP